MAELASTAQDPSRDFIRATPRNPLLGYLSDLAGSSFSPERTQQMQSVAQFFGAPAISQTLNRMAYGEPLTTGAGGIGGTSRLRPEVTEAAMSVMDFLPTSGIAKSAAVAAPMVAGMFIGKKAATWDALAAAKAKMLADMGTDARTIWKETGTWKGPDGKWRQEISDDLARIGSRVQQDKTVADISGRAMFDKSGGIPQMGDVLKHDDLYKSYPVMRDIGLEFDGALGGAYSAENLKLGGPGTVQLGYEVKGTSTPLHEIQHAIQQREGFARGGNPQSTIPDIALARENLRDIERKMERLQDAASDEALYYISKAKQEPEYKKFVEDAFEKYKKQFGERSESNPYGVDLQTAVKFDLIEKNNSINYFGLEADKLRKMANLDPYQAYRNLAGEAEARAVQKRRNMTPEQRQAMFPEESYDVPINELIIRGTWDDFLEGIVD